jgi:hypothetical protein
MRVGFISDTPTISSSLEDSLYSYLIASGHSMQRLDRLSPDAPVLQKIKSLINTSDVVIAAITKAHANIFYEIGLVHGQQKPVILLALEKVSLPSDLLGQHCIKFTDTPTGIKRAVFSIRSVLEGLDRKSKQIKGLKGPNEQFADYFESPDYVSRIQFRNLYSLHWLQRYKLFKQWFEELASALPSFDVTTSEGHQLDVGYDLLIWNNYDDSDLRVLGNPIPVEFKSVNSIGNAKFNQLLELAERTNIKGMILATTGKNTAASKHRLAKFRSKHGVFAVCLDRDSLSKVHTSRDLLMALKAAVRETMYWEA